MRVDRVTANVRYSKQMPDGAFKTVELGCESSLTDGDEDWREVQTNLYRQLGEQMRYVFSGNGSGKVAQEPPMPETLAPKREHWCEEHQTEYQRFNKEGTVWYSHKAPDGKWCREK
jgi:hypothetical protein